MHAKKSVVERLSVGFDKVDYSSKIVVSEYTRFIIDLEQQQAEKEKKEAREKKREEEQAKELGEEMTKQVEVKDEIISNEDFLLEADLEETRFSPPTLQLFDIKNIDQMFEVSVSGGNYEERQNNKDKLKALKELGSTRKLGFVENDCQTRLDSLEKDFPNFHEVVNYLRTVFAIARADDCTARPAHILLNGAPGVGKTLFASRLASIIGTTMKVVHLETMQTSNDLIGNSTMYGNTKPGLIFNTLMFEEYANPLLLLDEIDKCMGDEQFPTEAALYNLLEVTSKNFHDDSLPWLDIDASRIIYVATSNYPDRIDQPIMSRLMRFDIEAPTIDQCRIIVQNIFNDVVSSRPKAFSQLRLTEGAVEKMLELCPRKMRAAITTAAGNALLAQSNEIEAHHIKIEAKKIAAKIGF